MPGHMTYGDAAADQAFQRILASIKQLPSPSEVCLAVTRATEAEQTTLIQLQALVESDIALSGRLMQVANSAFFGMRQPVTSVRRAIALLGFATVRTLALGFFFNEEFGKLRLPGLPYPDLPRFALASSVLAEAIADRAAPELKGEAACLGLLHESGVIIMAMTYGGPYRQMLLQHPPTSGALSALEQQTFGMDHALAGKLLFEGWRLSGDLALAVADHHRPQTGDEGSPPGRTLWRILVLAEALTGPLLTGSSPQPAECSALAERHFQWSPEPVGQVLQEAGLMYRQRLGILGLGPDATDADGACQEERRTA